jgi:hypothetical protein
MFMRMQFPVIPYCGQSMTTRVGWYKVRQGWFWWHYVGHPLKHWNYWWNDISSAFTHQVPSGSRLWPIDDHERQIVGWYKVKKGWFWRHYVGHPQKHWNYWWKDISSAFTHQVPSGSDCGQSMTTRGRLLGDIKSGTVGSGDIMLNTPKTWII